ncbi:MAG: adenylate/guanylate cyclase domain-containing protein, partial [Candidatus Berkiellales bacterium]
MADFPVWPERIKQAFFELQYQSELIVAGVQAAIIVILFMIMFLTPINYSPDAPIHSAILGLSLFSILVLVRFYFAYTRQLTSLWLGLFVIAEMILLLFIIWSYQLQFETSPVIILKNSHLNYIFILIVLRALRFEPIWVILSGVTAIIGWSFLVGYVLHTEGLSVITWDYVTYASSS